MPNNSVFDDLTADEIALIEEAIKARNFKDYDGLVVLLNQQGLEISRSALWRRGKSMKDRLKMLKDTTDTAMMIGESVKDEGGNLSDVTLSLIQAGLFKTVNKIIDDDGDEAEDIDRQVGLLSEAAKAASNLGRASVMVKKYQVEVKKRLEQIADNVAKTAKKGGLSAEAVELIKREILGVAS